MHLYDPTTGRSLMSDQERAWGDQLITLFNEMIAAGVPAMEVSTYIIDVATTLRLENVLSEMYLKKRPPTTTEA